MKTYNVTIQLENVVLDDEDEESLKESVKEAVQMAIEMDDDGEEDLVFTAEEDGEDF